MGKETVILFISVTYFVASDRSCKLCDFDKRFEQVRPTCQRRSIADDISTSKCDTNFPQQLMMSTTKDTTTTDGTSSGTTSGADCFEKSGNITFQIEHGSSTVNGNCTRRITCTNGEISVTDEYNCSSVAVCDMRNDVRRCFCVSGYYGDGQTCINESKNCLDVFNDGYTADGVYSIQPINWNGPPFDVYCNMSEGGGWTVLQRRVNGSVDFYRNWNSYKGFGELDHEFWLGNDKLYYLTNQGSYILRIDLVNRYGEPYYAEYDLFRINDESDNYTLSELGAFSGTARKNAFQYHLNDQFSTFDRDNDVLGHVNCAIARHAGWWYKKCTTCNLNGDYHSGSISWWALPGGKSNVTYTEMKIRPTYD